MMGYYRTGAVEKWGEKIFLESFIENLILWDMIIYWCLRAVCLRR